ncbi:MAG: choice-of-anchor Q domain-containing protein [Bacteriovorax sp.]
MKVNIYFLRLLVLIVCQSSFAMASTYHIRKDGSDTSCNGLTNAPSSSLPNCAFLTVQKGINSAQAGDAISVHAGDYSSESLSSSRSGTSNGRIIIAAASGEVATLGTTIKISHDYLTVQGFQVTNFPSYPSALFEITGSNTEIRNNYIYSNSAKDFEWSVGMHFGGTNNILDGNTFDGKGTGPNVNVPSIWIPIVFDGSGHTVSRNVFKNISNCERVFDINSGTNITILDNEVFNLWQNLNTGNTHVDIFQNWCQPDATAFACPTMSVNFIIERNYFHDIQGQISNMGDGGGPFIVRNNIFANITSAWFFNTQHVQMTGNTFYRVGTEMDYAIYSYGANADISGLLLENNIFFAIGAGDPNNVPYAIDTQGRCRNAPCVLDYNFVTSASLQSKSAFTGVEVHGVNGGDPKFIAPFSNCVSNLCNFNIALNSIVIDKGTVVSGYSTDYLGNIRTAPWDIGAFEYSSSSLPTLSLTPPKNLRVL